MINTRRKRCFEDELLRCYRANLITHRLTTILNLPIRRMFRLRRKRNV